MDTFDKNKKLLATILNKVFCIYNQKKYRKYFIESNFDVKDVTIVPDLLKEEIPDLLGE